MSIDANMLVSAFQVKHDMCLYASAECSCSASISHAYYSVCVMSFSISQFPSKGGR